MMSKTIKEKLDQLDNMHDKLIKERLEDIVGDRFGKYAKYIIQDRAIPDVRDGLKPVQRRILYGVYKLGIFSDKPFKKSARICGEVMGKYHPHGDTSIYDALVRMSQDFKMRMPLIDMQGNNGSIDGDSAAAMRYTEARLSKASELLLADLDKRTVDFVPNFDDEELEPIVLPAKFPNLLINGASGISAGYATEIPPHNLKEVIDGTIYLIDNPDASLDEIMNFIKGPDFPTGGIIQGIDGIKEAYKTGRGKIIIRAKTHFEEAKGFDRLIITEIPYEVNKSELVKKIDQIRIDKKFEDYVEVRDESDREGLRIAIDLKKNANKELVLNYLFKNTDLQVSYNFNMVSICNRRPLCQGIIPMLSAYINHQKEVITNRSNYELEKSKKRLHIVLGLIKMVSILDSVITTIRESKNKADSKENLIKKFDFSEQQAEAIVMLQLYRLSNTDVKALELENIELEKKIKFLNKILSNEKTLMDVIKKELLEVSNLYSDPRRSLIENEISQIKINEIDLISNDDVMVQVSKDGYIKRSSLKSLKTSTVNGMKENDTYIFQKEINMKDTLLIFTNLGNYLFLPVYEIPDFKWKDIGTYINNVIKIQNEEKIIKVFHIKDFNENKVILLASKKGYVKQTLLKDFLVTRYKTSIKAINLAKDDYLRSCDIMEMPTNIILTSEKGEVLKFRASEISIVKTNASGVYGLKLQENDYLASANYTRNNDEFVLLTNRGNIKRFKVSELKLFSRYRRGTQMIKYIKTNPHIVVSAKRLSPEQLKENVDVTIINLISNLEIKAKDLKNSQSDSGILLVDTKTLGEPIDILINDTLKKEEFDILENNTIEKIEAKTNKEDKIDIFKGLDIDLDKNDSEDDIIDLFNDFLE